MKYYVLFIGPSTGKIHVAGISRSPKTIEEWEKDYAYINYPLNGKFLVDEERYNRWWRQYIDRNQ